MFYLCLNWLRSAFGWEQSVWLKDVIRDLCALYEQYKGARARKPSQDWGKLVYFENWENLSWCYKTSKVIQLNKSVSSVTQSCLTLCDLVDCSTPGFLVHHQLLELAQTHVHQVHEIQPCLPLSSPSPPAFCVSQHQGLFQWISSLHQVVEVLEF